MANMSAGTRGLSAGDWIRLKRLNGGVQYRNDFTQSVTNPSLNTSPFTVPGRLPRIAGTSKARHTASQYTDFVASQSADFVTKTATKTNGNVLTVTKVCTCVSTRLDTKVGLNPMCSIHTHLRIM
jgi:hypothetical protein